MAEAANLLLNNEIYLYGDVGDPWGWGDGFTPSQVATALVDHGAGPVTVRINSGGGIAFDGMAIYSLFKAHAGKVTMIIDGVAASAASLIAMAGDAREMRDGAMIMIHDPASITMGPAKSHEESAARLHKLAENYASVYALHSGMDAKDVRTLMLATTWMSADEAVANKFATAKITDTAKAMAAFDYQIYASAPDGAPVRVRPFPKAADAANTPKENDTMTPEQIAAAAAAQTARDTAAATAADLAAATAALSAAPAPAAKNWAASFYASAGATGVTLADLNVIVASSATVDAAKDALITKMAENNAGLPGIAGARASVVVDAREKFVTGVTMAIDAKAGNTGGERNEFSGRRLFEIARMSLELNGGRRDHRDDMSMIASAMAPVIMAGALSTSDFVNILANVANKSMLKGYAEADETFAKWTSTGVLSDFKTISRVDLGLFPNLDKVEEGAEYNYAKMSDRGITLTLATYGKMFPITRQAIINDDLNAFTKIPAKMGRAAHRTVGNLVYAVLTGNVVMPDTFALFSAQHKNLGTGAGSAMGVNALDAGRVALGKQTDKDAIAVALNIRPKYLLAPIALQGTAHQLIASQTEPGQNNAALANRVANMAEVITDGRLDIASLTSWYLSADPATSDTIEVSYLNGVQTPTLEQREGWNVDGIEFKVRHDAGVNLLDYVGLYKGAGA
jgi:ATP-dependent protease ClpP protease subunit/phage major head subunit gpT-like protein